MNEDHGGGGLDVEVAAGDDGEPIKCARRSWPAGNLHDHPQRIGVLDYRVPPEPLTFRRLQPVQPVTA